MFYLKKNPLIIKKIKTSAPGQIFLTFDDGPDENFTSQVLDLLAEEKWLASFFVVGQKAEIQKSLITRMIREGHAVMSHSSDHVYSHYFKGKNHLKNWLKNSLQNLKDITQLPQQVFRPPAGILTPPLLKAAQELQIPLVLWNQRYFDTALTFTEKKIQKHLSHLSAGDIILLHDCQPAKRQATFLLALRQYVQKMKSLGFSGGRLSNELITQELSHAHKSQPN